MEEDDGKLREIESKIGYTFKCKLWLVEALTHKSYIDQNKPAQDRERYLRQNPNLDITISSEIGHVDVNDSFEKIRNAKDIKKSNHKMVEDEWQALCVLQDKTLSLKTFRTR